jgi:uncharacterized repeat protein (TIGR03803 family)
VQGLNGNLYGTAPAGGLKRLGTIFELTREGKVEEAYTFHGSDPASPGSGLIVLPDGALCGTAPAGGANGFGGIFRFTPGGTITTLHSFNMTDGAVPLGVLVEGNNGMLYGTTSGGDFIDKARQFREQRHLTAYPLPDHVRRSRAPLRITLVRYDRFT